MFKGALVLVLALLIGSPSIVHAEAERSFSVQMAYLSLGAVYKNIDLENTKIRRDNAYYLDELFKITGGAVRARYLMMTAFSRGQYKQHFNEEYKVGIEEVMIALSNIDAPSSTLRNVERLISDAMLDQYQFFDGLVKRHAEHPPNTRVDWALEMKNEKVRSSHWKLLEAGDLLRRTYVDETEENKLSIKDHVRVLDFLLGANLPAAFD